MSRPSGKNPLFLILKLFCFMITGVASFSLIYSMYYMKQPKIKPWYFSLKDYFNAARPISAASFNISGDDVIVFLHMQKTGGTIIGKHLVHDLDLKVSCQKNDRAIKRYNCFRPNSGRDRHWLFSRYTTGWKCGLHADWTSLHSCVDDYYGKGEGKNHNKYYYFTYLREPVSRFLSEWKHQQRSATWAAEGTICNGKKYPKQLCHETSDWRGVTLGEYTSCTHNWAYNRQTRMLANLTLINCDGSGYTQREKEEIMLESAKRNLEDMAFFGLLQEQEKSRLMFEHVFDLHFTSEFITYETIASNVSVPSSLMDVVREGNHLDMKLFEFAVELFNKRWTHMERIYPKLKNFKDLKTKAPPLKSRLIKTKTLGNLDESPDP